MRRIALIAMFLAALLGRAADTNYFCVVCGKGPLTGHIWISKRGAICDDCYRLASRCSICGLPIREDDPSVIKTGDGRFICKFDKPNVIMTAAQAEEVFADARRELIGLFGSGFALRFPDVKVNLFDVDYWSENGRTDGLHKFGFASTRATPRGECTHEVVMLSGRLHTELEATAAHEYTHLWINENRPASHVMDGDTTEAICELSAYKLMQALGQTNQMQSILNNPYTQGEIKTLVALEQEHGIAWVLNWVKNGVAANFDRPATALALPVRNPPMIATNVAPPLPVTLRLDGVLLAGQRSRAIIGGESFIPGEVKRVKLRDRLVQVRCVAIHPNDAVVEVDGNPARIKLTMGGGN